MSVARLRYAGLAVEVTTDDPDLADVARAAAATSRFDPRREGTAERDPDRVLRFAVTRRPAPAAGLALACDGDAWCDTADTASAWELVGERVQGRAVESARARGAVVLHGSLVVGPTGPSLALHPPNGPDRARRAPRPLVAVHENGQVQALPPELGDEGGHDVAPAAVLAAPDASAVAAGTHEALTAVSGALFGDEPPPDLRPLLALVARVPVLVAPSASARHAVAVPAGPSPTADHHAERGEPRPDSRDVEALLDTVAPDRAAHLRGLLQLPYAPPGFATISLHESDVFLPVESTPITLRARVVGVSHALSAERMSALYGTPQRPWSLALWAACVRHVARGVLRRVRRSP